MCVYTVAVIAHLYGNKFFLVFHFPTFFYFPFSLTHIRSRSLPLFTFLTPFQFLETLLYNV